MPVTPRLTPEQHAELLKCEFDEVPRLAAEYHAANSQEGSWQDYLPDFTRAWTDSIPKFVSDMRAPLHEAICVDLNACANRHIFNGVAFQVALEAALDPIIARWATGVGGFLLRRVPLYLVAEYVIRNVIDELCGCA
jgi:hypothetical protein